MFLKILLKSSPSIRLTRNKEIINFSLVKQFSVTSSTFNEQQFAVLSLYHLHKIKRVHQVSKRVSKWLKTVNATGRFHINSQGVNCQLCFIDPDQVELFRNLLSENLGVESHQLRPNVQFSDFDVFGKLRVKKKLLELLDDDSDVRERGKHIGQEEWNDILDNDSSALVLDIRNDYEWDIGRFKQAERPKFREFSQFPEMVQEVVKKVKGKETKVLMYCTGGIRCEVFSNLLMKEGVKNVYQLQDGVLGYGAGSVEDSRHWEGNLYVFDDRMVVPIDGVAGGDKDKPISECKFCQEVTYMMYNCTNNQCNTNFVACLKCAAEMQGFCSNQCRSVTPAVKQFLPRNFHQWRGNLVGRGRHYRHMVDEIYTKSFKN